MTIPGRTALPLIFILDLTREGSACRRNAKRREASISRAGRQLGPTDAGATPIKMARGYRRTRNGGIRGAAQVIEGKTQK
jgi:hypothetical protein